MDLDYLTAECDWSEDQEEALRSECAAQLDAAVNAYLDTPPVPPETMFDYLYEKLPKAYQPQRDEVSKRGGRNHG